MFSTTDPQSPLILRGASASFLIDALLWSHVLTLARTFGWRPDGPPIPPEADRPAEWDTGYLFRHDQRITTRDARTLADALERSLPDIPDHDARGHGASESLLARFSGPAKPWLDALIRFLGAGSFIVNAEAAGVDQAA